MIFHTIQPTAGLTPERRRQANRIGPPATSLRSSYPRILGNAGFVGVIERDDTDEYHATQQRWIVATERREKAIRTTMGDDAYDDRLRSRRARLAAIEDGLLSRFRYSATR